MFSLHGRGGKLCDGLTRRELLRVGGLSAVGLSLPALLRASESASLVKRRGATGARAVPPTFGRAKNVIFLWLQGGPPQHETFDPKPDAPADIRGVFKPIQSNIPGIQFCELLPRTVRIADKLAVIRSLSTDNNIHSASGYWVLTGYKYVGPNARTIQPTDWPYFGSLVKMRRPSQELPPLTSVWVPDIMRLNENVTPAGQTGGFLGRRWDPERFVGDPSAPDYEVKGLGESEISPLRLERRVSLLEQVERHFALIERGGASELYDTYQQQAFDLVSTGRARKAFAIREEPAQVRDAYGRNKWGQTVLLARRLIEAGVRLVHVNWCREPGDSAVDNPMWDTHAQNADRLEDVLCPQFDVGFTALINDLDQRGLLDETLVVAVGEFGRTPKINGLAGRDHWGHVFSLLLAGAGISGGQVYGSSDKNGAYPASDRVEPGDLTATLFHLLGIDHEGVFHDRQNRPHRLTLGTPLDRLLGTEPATRERTTPGGDAARLGPWDDSPLLNTDFAADVPLRPIDFGSRPKGWRAGPLVDDAKNGGFGVRFVDAGQIEGVARPEQREGRDASGQPADTARRRCVLIGYGVDGPSSEGVARPERSEGRGASTPPGHALAGRATPAPDGTAGQAGSGTHSIDAGQARIGTQPIEIPQGAEAILAQEIRNPRVGHYTLTALICGRGSSRDYFDRVFLANFTCRLVIFRFADSAKNATRREELASQPFRPSYLTGWHAHARVGMARPESFQLQAVLDSKVPGQNFAIGRGLGVAVIVEKTSPGVLMIHPDDDRHRAFVQVASVNLDYRGRGFDKSVKV